MENESIMTGASVTLLAVSQHRKKNLVKETASYKNGQIQHVSMLLIIHSCKNLFHPVGSMFNSSSMFPSVVFSWPNHLLDSISLQCSASS